MLLYKPIIILPLFLLIISCADKGTSNNSPSTPSDPQPFSGLVFTYSLFYEKLPDQFFSEVHIIDDNTDNGIMPGDSLNRGYCTISPDGSKLVYARAHDPESAYCEICISKNRGISESVIFSDSMSFFSFPTWVADNKIAFLQDLDSITYITFLDTHGTIISKVQVQEPYILYFVPEINHLICILDEHFADYDVALDHLTEFIIDSNYLEKSQPPVLFNGKLFMSIIPSFQGYDYLLYNIDYKTFQLYNSGLDSVDIIYMDSSRIIGSRIGLNRGIILFDGSKVPLDTIPYLGTFKIGLPYFKNNIFNCVGEEGNDVWTIYKVDFSAGQIERMTEYGIDRYIVGVNLYEF